MQLLEHLDTLVPAERGRGRGPFADAVKRQDQRPLERRWIKCACRMAQVMLAEAQPAAVEILVDRAQLLDHQILLEQFLAQPDRHGGDELPQPARHGRQVGLQQPLEFDEWLLGKHHGVDIGKRAAALGQAVRDGLPREVGVVLPPGEALFLRGGDDAAILHERGRAVVVVSRQAENSHQAFRRGSEQGVDERRDGGSLGHNHEAAEQAGEHDDRDQPVFLAHQQEFQQLAGQRHGMPQYCLAIEPGGGVGWARRTQ
jgi:hypothetical protein